MYLVFACLFSCTALFVSISQVIGCEVRLRNDLYTVSGGALNSAQPQPVQMGFTRENVLKFAAALRQVLQALDALTVTKLTTSEH